MPNPPGERGQKGEQTVPNELTVAQRSDRTRRLPRASSLAPVTMHGAAANEAARLFA
jgi:hypothetical protein